MIDVPNAMTGRSVATPAGPLRSAELGPREKASFSAIEDVKKLCNCGQHINMAPLTMAQLQW